MMQSSIRRLLRPKVVRTKVLRSFVAPRPLVRLPTMHSFRCFNSQLKSTQQTNFEDEEQAAVVDSDRAKEVFSETVFEFKSYKDWETLVLQSETPVILLCYEDTCSFCQKLIPRFEKATVNSDGKFKLVKANIVLFPDIYLGFSVNRIPAVFLLFKGEIKDAFIGLPHRELFDDFVSTAKQIDSLFHEMKTVDNYPTEDHIVSEGKRNS